MAKEIERKFLVTGQQWREGRSGEAYRQGYLSRQAGRTVRVRTAGGQAFLTIKGPPEGIVRDEYEYPIPMEDAVELFRLCEGPLIEKTRFLVPYGSFTWEIDEFHGENSGLIVAEIELPSATTPFALPPWVGAEVSDDPRYSNARLSVNPFRNW